MAVSNVTILENVDVETPLSIRDNILRVDWVDIGEGLCGDYNPDDENDIPLLRFDVYVNSSKDGNPDNWEEVEDASYCTRVSVNESKDVLEKKLRAIFNAYRETIYDYPISFSVKKLGESLSWI